MLMCCGGCHLARQNMDLSPVPKNQKIQWLNYVIPLPKEVAIERQLECPLSQVRVRVRENASDVECYAAKKLAKILKKKINDRSGAFEILLGVCDANGMVQGLHIPQAAKLNDLPNRQQAYYVTPHGENRLVVTALDEKGLFYGAMTLKQLIEPMIKFGKARIPLCEITDWPDLAERGRWGRNHKEIENPAFIDNDIEWFALVKLNLIEAMQLPYEFGENDEILVWFDADKLELAHLNAIHYVPTIRHLDRLAANGFYDVFSEIEGQGKKAHALAGNGSKCIAPCTSNPKLAEILGKWFTKIAAYEYVDEIMCYLSEHHVQCQCEQCAEGNQYVGEARAIIKAWRTAKEQYPDLRLRILLTQGSYETNDQILRVVPPQVGISYYHGGYTYRSSKDPLIDSLLADYAAKGRWLGCYPILTPSWRIVCPWSCPQYVRFRCRELVDKKLSNVAWFKQENRRLHDFNLTAAAEWSWNVRGRNEREFTIAWATRKGIKNPQLVADWAEQIGPASWNLYGAGFPFVFANQPEKKTIQVSRKANFGQGIYRYWDSLDALQNDIRVTEKALDVIKQTGHRPLIAETKVINGYLRVVRYIALASNWTPETAPDISELKKACRQVNRGLKAWVGSMQIGPARREQQFAETMGITDQILAYYRQLQQENRHN